MRCINGWAARTDRGTHDPKVSKEAVADEKDRVCFENSKTINKTKVTKRSLYIGSVFYMMLSVIA